MLAGTPAFAGATLLEVLHAVAHDQPPVLSGSPAVSALDAVVHRALSKRPADRYAAAGDMSAELRATLARVTTGEMLEVRAVTRLMVLPFRLLRPDAEVDFLAFSLPDAITASFSGLDSVVVRSSLAAARFANADPAALARDAQVDLVLSGALLRAGDQVRIQTQLMEVPSGTVVWSHTTQVVVGDVFHVQDTLTRRIVDSLTGKLNPRDQRRLKQDVPASPEAYELFLRANTLSADSRHWSAARDLYRRCVELDPNFAPAWARLGRCYRVLGKFGLEGAAPDSAELAERAFARALELNPDLPVAHHLSTYLEVERGRALPALVRLLGRAKDHLNDPEMYAGIVHACRYVGLLDASIAAAERAKRLDPNVRTSLGHTLFMAGDYERAIAEDVDVPPYTSINSLVLLGRHDEARKLLAVSRRDYGAGHLFVELLTALHEGTPTEIVPLTQRMLATQFHDPEGWYYWGRLLLAAGEPTLGCDLVVRAMNGGFHCFPGIVRDPWLDPIRNDPGFVHALRLVERGHREAQAVFDREGGPPLLAMR
jgi:TolB-like protein/tetratricopeptide (TPR) repeat protein